MEKKEKLTFVKGFWVFFFGCILGFIIETLFYIVKYGAYSNKQGLIYGPFKPIYGIGALLITIIYYLLKKKSLFNVFITGFLAGTIFEYLASLFIELVFNSYIWDYSGFGLDLNGRIYLPYCFVWGLISVCWIKWLYPLILKFYAKIEGKLLFKVITIIMIVFMALNVLITAVVLIRRGDKDKTNGFYKIIDKYYPEKTINKKFPKLRPIE